MAGGCSPPKSQRVTLHYRSKPRRRQGPRRPPAGTTYYVAENNQGHTCGHHHKGVIAAARCSLRENRHARRTRGNKAATYAVERKVAK